MARNDIRISAEFPTHPKTKKLRRRLGGEAAFCLIELWCFASQRKKDGRLTGMASEDIALAADWPGDADEFVRALYEVGFLDLEDEVYSIHDWSEHQPWVANSEQRSQQARANAMKRWDSDADGKPAASESDANRMQVACEPHANRNAPSPSPTPSPTPTSHAHGREAESTTPDSSAVVAELEFEPTPVSNLEALWSSLKGKNPPFRPFDYEAMRECLTIAGGDLALVEAVVRKGYQAAKERRNAPSSFRYFPDLVRQEVERRGLVAAPVNVAPLTPPPTRAAPEPIQVVALRERIARQLADDGKFPDYPSALRTVNSWPVERLEEEQQKWTA